MGIIEIQCLLFSELPQGLELKRWSCNITMVRDLILAIVCQLITYDHRGQKVPLFRVL